MFEAIIIPGMLHFFYKFKQYEGVTELVTELPVQVGLVARAAIPERLSDLV